MKFKLRGPKFGSFGADGLVFAIRKERHVQRYLVFILIFFILGIIFDFNYNLYALGLVYFLLLIIFELFNTSIEILCDFVTEDHAIEIKRIKDLSAGAIFVHGFFGGTLLVVTCLMYVLR